MQQGPQGTQRGTGRRARRGIGLACVVAAVATVPGGIAVAASPATGNASAKVEQLLANGGAKAGKDAPSLAELQRSLARPAEEARVEAAAAAVARRARIGSAAARAERRRSVSAFGGLGAASALRLTQQQFGRDLEAVSTTPADSLAADRVLGFEDDHTARVDVPGAKEHQLAISTVQPFRVRDDAGRKALVDLDLQPTDGGFAPANPIVDVTLPSASDGELTVGGDLSLTASLPGGTAATARRIGDSSLFYPEAGTDTDLVAAPTSTGLETFFTLRSAQSPETAALTFDLPKGASLLAQENGSVNVVRDGKRIGGISAPVAKDAQGTPVATSASVDGDTVTVHTAHRGKDVAYPILVDPIVEVDSLEYGADVDDVLDTEDLSGNPTNTWLRLEGDVDNYDVTGAQGDGLYLHDYYLSATHGGGWVWLPPQANNHIYDVDFTGVDFSRGGDPSTGAALFAFINAEGTVADSILTDTADDEVFLSDEDTDTGSPGTEELSAVEFLLLRIDFSPPINPYDHEAFVGGAVMHVEDLDDSDGPTFDDFDPETLPTETVWTNANDVGEDSVLAATSYAHGVKRVEITAQSGTDPEIVLGYTEDPCDGTPLAPCPTTLAEPFDVDWTLLAEGHYTLRFRAIDGASNASVITFAVGVDRTAPDATLGGSLAALDGLTTASTSTLNLTVAGEETDDLTISGTSTVAVYDSMSEFSANLDCAVDDCDDLDFDVDLSTLSEGEHTFTAYLYDRAGNDSEEHVTFTIDRP